LEVATLENITLNLTETLKYIIPLLGVTLGFFLNIVCDKYKLVKSHKNKKEAIMDELSTNLGIIPQKIDILKQMQDALRKSSILPGDNVSFSSPVYNNYIGDITYKLSKSERENLQQE